MLVEANKAKKGQVEDGAVSARRFSATKRLDGCAL
jgi:hypothetical protein